MHTNESFGLKHDISTGIFKDDSLLNTEFDESHYSRH